MKKRILQDGSEETSAPDFAVPAAFDMPYFAATSAPGAQSDSGEAARSASFAAGCSIVAGAPILIDDVKGDGFGGDLIWIDDGCWDPAGWYEKGRYGTGGYEGDWSGGGDWYDGGTYDGGTYDGGTYDGGTYDGGTYEGGVYDYSSEWTAGVGDINGDGIEDSLRASYDYADGGFSGSTYIVFGGSDESFLLTERGQNIYGWSVGAAGDVNGDGFDDLLVSTYDYDTQSSAAYVVFGAPDGFGDEVDVASLDGENGFRIQVTGGDDAYAYVYAAGDVDGDGFADLAVSVYEYASGAYGEIVVYGAADFDARLKLSAAEILADYPLGT